MADSPVLSTKDDADSSSISSRSSGSHSRTKSSTHGTSSKSIDRAKSSRRHREHSTKNSSSSPRHSNAGSEAISSSEDNDGANVRDALYEAKRQIEREKKKSRTLKDEIDSMGRENMDALKKLREEIELLKAEVSMDAASDDSRRMSESATSTESTETSVDEPKFSKHRRVSDADTHAVSDSILSIGLRHKRSKDDLDLLGKKASSAERHSHASPPKKHRGAVVPEVSERVPPKLSQLRPATSVQLPRKPPMVRSGTTVDPPTMRHSSSKRHRRTHSDEENDGAMTERSKSESGRRKMKHPTKSIGPDEISVRYLTSGSAPDSPLVSDSSSDGLANVTTSSGLLKTAGDLKNSRLVESRSNSKLAKILGDDVKASKMLGIDVSRVKLMDSPRSARSASAAETPSSPHSARERSATSAAAASSPSPSPTAAPSFDVQEAMVLQRDPSGAVLIRGGTAQELFNQLVTNSSGVDHANFTSTFLITYHSFMTASELITQLVTYFDTGDQTVDLRIARSIEIFDMWLDHRHRDFVDDKEVYFTFARFLEQQLKPLNAAEAGRLISKLEDKRSHTFQKAKRRLAPPSEADTPASPSSKELLYFKHRGIAMELTMLLNDLFQAVEPMELLTQHKRKPGTKDVSRISIMINQFNLISNWAATEIVKQEHINKRWKVMYEIMKVAIDCLDMQNYDTATAIISGLQSAAVARLALTWTRVQEEKPKIFQRYRAVEALLSSEDNYKAYRGLAANVKPPCIPFLGVALKDVVFISDGNPDTLEADFGKSNFLNFDKRAKLANIVLEARRLQSVPYDYKRDTTFRRYLDNFEVLEDIELYNASLVAEARVKRPRAKISASAEGSPAPGTPQMEAATPPPAASSSDAAAPSTSSN